MLPIIPSIFLLIPYKNSKISMCLGIISIILSIAVASWCNEMAIHFELEAYEVYYKYSILIFSGFDFEAYKNHMFDLVETFTVAMYYAIFSLISGFLLLITPENKLDCTSNVTSEPVYNYKEIDQPNFCRFCGEELDSPDDEFCLYCGEKLK